MSAFPAFFRRHAVVKKPTERQLSAAVAKPRRESNRQQLTTGNKEGGKSKNKKIEQEKDQAAEERAVETEAEQVVQGVVLVEEVEEELPSVIRPPSHRTYAKRPERRLRESFGCLIEAPCRTATLGQLQQQQSPAASRPSRQLYIDAGQKDLSGSACIECGMYYVKGDPTDTSMHRRFHRQFLASESKPSPDESCPAAALSRHPIPPSPDSSLSNSPSNSPPKRPRNR
ncbi:MAG: C2H2-type zinc finger protein [archaeon]|nr:C2H2-type zinc finger protein [archaeon]